MSISEGNIGLMRIALNDVCDEAPIWKNLKMGELGNQKILSKGKNGKEFNRGCSKEIFTLKGVEHTSFDLNALDDAIALDLCKPLPSKWNGYFDMVTNYGTTEHVGNQYQVFKNIHEMTRVGGAMIHSVPHHGYWKSHCPFHYDMSFFKELALDNGYEISYTEIQKRHRTNLLVNTVLLKVDQEFQTEESFKRNQGLFHAKSWKTNSDNLSKYL